MAGDVAQGFLGYAVDDQLDLRGQRREVGGDVLCHLEPEPLGEPVGEHGQGAGETEIVERLRPQLERDPPHAFEAVAHRVLDGQHVLGEAGWRVRRDARQAEEDRGELLADLVETTPGDEAKWFAAAKEAGLYDEALALASRTPCDPRTLTRAARDLAERQPGFAVAGLLALRWLVHGHGYEIMGVDVWAAYQNVMKAAERAGTIAEARECVKQLVAQEKPGGVVTRVLGAELGL